MFDPTIFDNLKVVLEGELYDADREGRIEVIGREDTVELAGMSRTFRMKLRLTDGRSTAIVALAGELEDFAAEWRGLRLADDRPGAKLSVAINRPDFGGIRPHQWRELKQIWAGEGELSGETRTAIDPETGCSGGDTYTRIEIRFRTKIDESDVNRLPELVGRLEQTLAWADGTAV